MNSATQHHGGEEWRDMESGAPSYNPAASDSFLAQAKADILKLRRQSVTFRLQSRSGQPLAGVPVKIVQQRHAFLFGEQTWQMDAALRQGLTMDHDRLFYHGRACKQLLNAVTALCYWTERPRHDASKTEDIQGRLRLDAFRQLVDWAVAEGLTVKGHPLFWSISKALPQWVQRYDPDTQMKFAEVRVRQLVAGFKDKIQLWDATNEALWEPAPQHMAQRHWPHLEPIDVIADYLAKVLHWCYQENPSGCFVVNDYGLEQDKAGDDLPTAADGRKVSAALQRQRMLALMRALADRNVLPGAIGLQSHTGGWQDHRRQFAVYDELATSGLPLHITEFWLPSHAWRKQCTIPEDELLAMECEYLENYLTTAFAHPAVDAFFFWGTVNASIQWSSDHSSGHTLSPVYTCLMDLIHRQWHTRLQTQTDAQGQIVCDAFYGDYELQFPAIQADMRALRFTVDPTGSRERVLIVPDAWSTRTAVD